MVKNWLTNARRSSRRPSGFEFIRRDDGSLKKSYSTETALSPLGSSILAIIVFVLGLFLGVAAAKADEFPVKYVSVQAKVVLFSGETQAHGYQRVSRIIGEANKHLLSHLIQIELQGADFVAAPTDQTLYTILRDLVTETQGTYGTGLSRKTYVMFTTQAYGGQEGLAMLGSGCTDFAAAVVASKAGFAGEYPQNLVVSAARTLAHEFLHIWGASHSDAMVVDPDAGYEMPSIMHPYAVGSFATATETVDQIRNYLGTISSENYCLRDKPRDSGGIHPPVALSSVIDVTEGTSQSLKFSIPGLPPDFESCGLEIDDSQLPVASLKRLTDAVTGDYSVTFPMDTLKKGQQALFGITVRLTCSDYTSEQIYQIRLQNKDLSPLVWAPRVSFASTSNRNTNVLFTAVNPVGVPGKPVVKCSLPRGSRIQNRGSVYSFSVRPSKTTAYSCEASNSEGGSPFVFYVSVVRPTRTSRR